MVRGFMMSLVMLCLFSGCGPEEGRERTLLNVSYDPTREFYQEINAAFVSLCASDGIHGVKLEQAHGGSGKQARAVLDGLDADVVTLALGYDIDILAKFGKMLPLDWSSRLPNNSSPYYSTIVFLVRRGNPKDIRDWGDLVKEGVEVLTPNPKTSGGARWNYLAAWAWARRRFGSEDGARSYLRELFRHVPVLDTGARGSTNTFVHQGKGDVLLAWENEALLAQRERVEAGYEIVYPSVSIKAEPPVALVDLCVDLHRNRTLAEKYLQFLYSDMGQRIAARHYFRPYRRESCAAEDLARFREVPMVTIDDEFGGWMKAHEVHFANGGSFDEVMKK